LQPKITGVVTVESRGTHRIDIMNNGGWAATAKPRSQKMSTFNLSDITFVGAYMSAMKAAHDNNSKARSQESVSGGSRQKKLHGAWYSLPVRITAAGMVFAGYIMGTALVVIIAI
jgi:hypothetical protein